MRLISGGRSEARGASSGNICCSASLITVVADGRTVFEGTVKTSVATLLKWAAKDNDRTMLYGAELHLQVK